MTFFYTNAQSARLMFYHDHAMGITRLNVYAGEAAGYVITDQVDQDMINGTNVSGVNSRHRLRIKKFFPISGFLWSSRTGPSWTRPQSPLRTPPGIGEQAGPLGITRTDRRPLVPPCLHVGPEPVGPHRHKCLRPWHYGPWFNPPAPACDVNGLPVGCIEVGPVPNPYYQPDCDRFRPDPIIPTALQPWEPPLRPGTPNPSMPGEGFMDTPIVNGTAYPYLEVEPKAYRFRILNASNDRFFNLQLYVAADKTTPTTPGTTGTVLRATPHSCRDRLTKLHRGQDGPGQWGSANQYADSPSGIPDPTTKGPDWIQIGTEGGFMPKPVVVPQQPIGWNLNPTTFNFGIVNQHSLFLGSAERADVVVDFTAYAGKTLILYNDAPAAFPAGVRSLRLLHGRRRPDRMTAARPPRSPATVPTPAPLCRSG